MTSAVIDHVALKIPRDGLDRALAFYRDGLGFPTEELDAYRTGDRPLFSFRLGGEAVLHVRPVDDFSEPTRTNYEHVAIVFDEPVQLLQQRVESGGGNVVRTGNPLGATGRAPAIYAEDPFGYIVELKTR